MPLSSTAPARKQQQSAFHAVDLGHGQDVRQNMLAIARKPNHQKKTATLSLLLISMMQA